MRGLPCRQTPAPAVSVLDDLDVLHGLLQLGLDGLELGFEVRDHLLQQVTLGQGDRDADVVGRGVPEDRDHLVAGPHVVLAVDLGGATAAGVFAGQAVAVDRRDVFAALPRRHEAEHGADRVAEVAVLLLVRHEQGAEARPGVFPVQVGELIAQLVDGPLQVVPVDADQGRDLGGVFAEAHLQQVEALLPGQDGVGVDRDLDFLGSALAPAAGQAVTVFGEPDHAESPSRFASRTHGKPPFLKDVLCSTVVQRTSHHFGEI